MYIKKYNLQQILKTLRISAILSVLLLTLASSVFAATGTNKKINFQGKVVNTDGTNVSDNTYSFTFSIYTASSGGVAVWTETKNLSVVDSIFRTALGDTTTLPGSVDFNTDNIYLGVNFNSDGEMSPRIQFSAVPQALNALKVSGLTVTDTTGTLTIVSGKTVSFADAFTTAGAYATTLTSTATTNVTLPTSGTLYGTATGSITSAQLLASLTDETGTGLAVFNNAPTLAGSLTFSNFSTNGGLLYTNGSGVLAQTGAGTSTTVLHGGTTPTYGAIALATDVSGTLPVASGGTGQTTYTNGQLLIGNTTGNTLTKATLTGTTNQIVVTNGTGTITLSTPQDIATTSTPRFANLGIGIAANSNYGIYANYTVTDPATTTYTAYLLPTFSLTADNAFSTAGLRAGPTLNHGTSNYTSTMYGSMSVAAIAGTSGTVTAAVGALGNVNVTTGGTVTTVRNIYSGTPTNTGGGTITTFIGFDAAASTVATNNYAFRGANASASGTYNLYMSGTADNYFAGNVGIGTTSPDAKLEVSNNGTPGGVLRLTNSSTAISTGHDYGGIEFYANDASVNGTGISGFIRNLALNAGVQSALIFGTRSSSASDAVEYMRLDNLGNLGIGTTSPASLFSVGSSSQFQVNSSGAIAAVAGITSSSNYSQSAGTFSLTSANTTQTTTSSAAAINVNSLTSGTGLYMAMNSITTGTGIQISSSATSGITTAGTNVGSLLDITESGAMTAMTGQLVSINASGTNTSGATGSALNINIAGTAQVMNGIKIANATTTAVTGSGISIAMPSVTTTSGLRYMRFNNAAGTEIGSISNSSASAIAFNTSSDRRLKDNITDTHYGLADVLKISVKDFQWHEGNTGDTGFIAQDLYDIYPNAVMKGDNGTDPYIAGTTHTWSVDYGRVTPLLAAAIKDQQGLLGTYSEPVENAKALQDIQLEPVHDALAIFSNNSGKKLLTDLISARVTALRGYFDVVSVNSITTTKSDGLTLNLPNGNFAIKGDTNKQLVTFDNEGNAIFAGGITASHISASSIDGFNELRDSVALLVKQLKDQASDALSPVELTKLLAQSLNFAGNIAFAKDVTMQSGLIADAVDINKTLQVVGESNFKGEVTVSNKQAGFVKVLKGATYVDVAFIKPLINTPIVQVTAQGESPTYYVSQPTTKGFTLQLSAPANSDIQYAWIAVTANDPKTTVGKPGDAPIVPDVSPTPIPNLTPEGTPSPVINTAPPSSTPEVDPAVTPA